MLLRERIAAAFPDDAILGEEFSERAGTSGYRWIVDPIDGTKSFIHGVPLYGTLIGMEHRAAQRPGIIDMPALDECVYAAVGQGAWYVNGSPTAGAARFPSGPVGRIAVLHQRDRQLRRSTARRPSTIACKRPPGSPAPGAIATATFWWPPAGRS